MIAPEDRQAPVTEYFQQDAGFWEAIYDQDDVFSIIYRERLLRSLDAIGRLPLTLGSRVLEVGCGAGLLAIELARRGFRVAATDTTPAMLELTKRNAERSGMVARLDVELADVHALPYPDRTFELVVALGVLPWLHDPRTGLREMARVLQPGGYLLATADNRARLTHMVDPLFNPWLQPLRRALGHGRVEGAHARTAWATEVNGDLQASGLRLTRSFTVGFGPFTFFGRQAVRGRAAVRLHRSLQQLADEQLPLVRSGGCHYVVIAEKH